MEIQIQMAVLRTISQEESDWVDLDADLYCWIKSLWPVQWYPGHLAKTKKELEEQLKLTDIAIEVRDARIHLSPSHPQLGTKVIFSNGQLEMVFAFIRLNIAAENKHACVINTGQYEAKPVSEGDGSWCKYQTPSKRAPPSCGEQKLVYKGACPASSSKCSSSRFIALQ